MNKSLLVILPLIVVISGWIFINRTSQNDIPVSVTTEASPQATLANSPQAPPSDKQPTIFSTVDENTLPATEEPLSNNQLNATSASASASDGEIMGDVSSLGYQPLSDEAFNQIQSRLKSEPDYLTSVLTEFRSTTDPQRAKQLSALLADINDPRVYEIAAELAYSGDPASQLIGLELLNRIQTRSSDAREVAIQLLGTETSADVLVATMNVIATPANSATVEQRQLISDNLFLLSTHIDPKVRAHSLSVLGQWEKQNPSVTSALSDALQDTDSHVRARAVYALNGTQNIDETVTENLLLVLENTDENKATREAAMLILQNEQLGGSNLRRFTEGQRSLRTRKLVN